MWVPSFFDLLSNKWYMFCNMVNNLLWQIQRHTVCQQHGSNIQFNYFSSPTWIVCMISQDLSLSWNVLMHVCLLSRQPNPILSSCQLPHLKRYPLSVGTTDRCGCYNNICHGICFPVLEIANSLYSDKTSEPPKHFIMFHPRSQHWNTLFFHLQLLIIEMCCDST